MKATLVKIYIEGDDHDVDVEMFRVSQDEELLIEPKEGHFLTLENGRFFIDAIEQDLKKRKLFLYEKTKIPHYKFWGDRKSFLVKHLTPLLKKKWNYNEKACLKKFLSDVKKSNWRPAKLEKYGLYTT